MLFLLQKSYLCTQALGYLETNVKLKIEKIRRKKQRRRHI